MAYKEIVRASLFLFLASVAMGEEDTCQTPDDWRTCSSCQDILGIPRDMCCMEDLAVKICEMCLEDMKTCRSVLALDQTKPGVDKRYGAPLGWPWRPSRLPGKRDLEETSSELEEDVKRFGGLMGKRFGGGLFGKRFGGVMGKRFGGVMRKRFGGVMGKRFGGVMGKRFGQLMGKRSTLSEEKRDDE